MVSLKLLSHLKGLQRFDRRNLSLSSWRKSVKDLPVKNKMKFNVGGVQAELAEARENAVVEILNFMETEEGKKKMALWVGWGGTIILGTG